MSSFFVYFICFKKKNAGFEICVLFLPLGQLAMISSLYFTVRISTIIIAITDRLSMPSLLHVSCVFTRTTLFFFF